MLLELRIENFAIVDRINIQFEPGLVTFTGETGAGKSILIDAVETVLGGRADVTMIRSGSDKATIEATFDLPVSIRRDVNSLLNREDLLDNQDYIVLAREIRSGGRNIARINGRSTSVSFLREIGDNLVDVHGQSEHLSLLRVKNHITLLDSYAQVDDLLSTYKKTYDKLHTVRHELNELRRSERGTARQIDTLTFQINEIEAANLKSGEDKELLEERDRLANAEGLASLIQDALIALDEGTPETPSATDLVGQAINSLNGIVRLDSSQSPLSTNSQNLFDSLTELTQYLRSYMETVEFNPRRLDQVEERLNLIHNLKRKYGDNIEDVHNYAVKARQQLSDIENADERIKELEEEEINLLKRIGIEGQGLSEIRHLQAERLARSLESELIDLQMSGTRFKVDFLRSPDPDGAILQDGTRIAFDSSGLERAEFLIAPNPGEGLKPLAKIASGGETSRLMLALKNVLVAADHIPTLIFDEIDQGIGGRVGGIVGQKLRSLAQQHQVLCVTHLPQLAAYGNHHIKVDKLISEGRTITQAETVQGEARQIELASMLGGVSESTLNSARELLDSSGKLTQNPT